MGVIRCPDQTRIARTCCPASRLSACTLLRPSELKPNPTASETVSAPQVEDSDLASVKNMPAYLNKCFNNRLWKVRQ